MSERRYEIKDEEGTLKYVLRFRDIHDSRKLYSLASSHNLFLITGAMNCTVEYADGSHLGYGSSFCFHTDKWDAQKGERVSLKDALKLKNDKLQREARKFIWVEYFKQRPIKAKPTERQIRKAKVREAMAKLYSERHPTTRELLRELNVRVKKLEHPLITVETVGVELSPMRTAGPVEAQVEENISKGMEQLVEAAQQKENV